MALVEIPVPPELAAALEESFRQGAMWNADGVRLLTEDLVAKVDGVRIVIQADEHPPPHFHVRHAGENASFRIDDGSRLPNVRGLEKFEHNIRAWWKDNRCTLIEVWNRTRPTDCVVGPMDVPPECKGADDTKAADQ